MRPYTLTSQLRRLERKVDELVHTLQQPEPPQYEGHTHGGMTHYELKYAMGYWFEKWNKNYTAEHTAMMAAVFELREIVEEFLLTNFDPIE